MTCCYGDMPSVYESKRITARKEHTCCECSSKIRNGDVYEYVSGCWNGKWSHYKTCEKCADLAASVLDVICFSHGDLFEAYEYIVGEFAWQVWKKHNGIIEVQP